MISSVKGVYVCTFVGREHTFLSNERYTRFCLLNIFLPYVLPHGNLNLTHKKKEYLISTGASHIFIVEMKKSQVPGIELY